MRPSTEIALIALHELVPQILEEMFFAEAEAIDDVFDWSANNAIFSRISLHEPLEADLIVSVPTDLAHEFSETLTSDIKSGDSQLKDIVGELLNTLAGRLQVALARDDEACAVGLPETTKASNFILDEAAFHQTFAANELTLGVALAPKRSA
ncbi:MAG: chemotaxis protein CheX [Nannocystaceae bacterium]